MFSFSFYIQVFWCRKKPLEWFILYKLTVYLFSVLVLWCYKTLKNWCTYFLYIPNILSQLAEPFVPVKTGDKSFYVGVKNQHKRETQSVLEVFISEYFCVIHKNPTLVWLSFHWVAVIRGRTFWSQLSSQRSPLLARRFLLNKPSLLSELGNSARRAWRQQSASIIEKMCVNMRKRLQKHMKINISRLLFLTLSCFASSWESLKINPFSSCFTSSCKLSRKTLLC